MIVAERHNPILEVEPMGGHRKWLAIQVYSCHSESRAYSLHVCGLGSGQNGSETVAGSVCYRYSCTIGPIGPSGCTVVSGVVVVVVVGVCRTALK